MTTEEPTSRINNPSDGPAYGGHGSTIGYLLGPTVLGLVLLAISTEVAHLDSSNETMAVHLTRTLVTTALLVLVWLLIAGRGATRRRRHNESGGRTMKQIYGITLVISLFGASAQAQLPPSRPGEIAPVGGGVTQLAAIGAEDLGVLGFWHEVDTEYLSGGDLMAWYAGIEQGAPGRGRYWSGLQAGLIANPLTNEIWWQIVLNDRPESELTAEDLAAVAAVSAGLRYECPTCTIYVSPMPDYFPRKICKGHEGSYEASVQLAMYARDMGLADKLGPPLGAISRSNFARPEGGDGCLQGSKGMLEHGLLLQHFWSD